MFTRLTVALTLAPACGLGASRQRGRAHRACVHMKQRGFAVAPKPSKTRRSSAPFRGDRDPNPPLEADAAAALAALEAGGEPSLERYLDPRHFDDPATMAAHRATLRAGGVVVLRDAFRPAFAEAVFRELHGIGERAWELNEAYFDDGYSHRHRNVYDRAAWSARLNATLDLFASAPSREFVGALTGRECGGETTGAPSWYQAGDHSLPHTDWVGQRTVAFVWHLSKAWRPEWGGALYWAQHDHAVATYPASFNTLVLFSVTPRSAHFVTTVSPRHEGKRLTFNGWWHSAWTPRAADVDDLLGDRLATAERRALLTHAQLQAVTDLVDDPWQNFAGDRRDELRALQKRAMAELFPHGSRVTGVAA